MNAILTLTHNGLVRTQRALTSFVEQDIAVTVYAIDNGSTDGTLEWLRDRQCLLYSFPNNAGVSVGWNKGLSLLFADPSCESVLVVGNDTWLPSSFYRNLLACNVPFVTGVAVGNMDQALETPHLEPLENNPDFSAYCMKRDCWNRVGKFDERMRLYSSDQDYHLRAHRLGINLYKTPVPFYHERSSTLNLAPPEEQAELLAQADRDRTVLKHKWGVSAGGPDYEALFTSATFGIESNLVV